MKFRCELVNAVFVVAVGISVFVPPLACAQSPGDEQPGDAANDGGPPRPITAGPVIWQILGNEIHPVPGSPVIWQILGNEIHPVPGSDGLVHVPYVAMFTNKTPNLVTVQSIEVVDPAHGDKLTGKNQVLTFLNEDVTGELLLFSRPATLDKNNYSTDLGAGQSVAGYFDVTYPDKDSVPHHISHRVTASLINTANEKQEYVVIDKPMPVSGREPIVLSPPLRGARWLDANGCCKQIGPHRWVLNPINGALKTAEMFAMDLVQLNAQGKGVSGDPTNVGSYPYYGADILAAAAGTVVEVVRDLPDQVPGPNAPPTTLDTAAGNHVIIAMGQGRYALYAHMVPGSPTIQAGDVVYQGQRIGALGNSGSTTFPHLHFQVMDRPSTLDAHGLPFVFDNMELEGRFTGNISQLGEWFFEGLSLPIDHQSRASLQRVMPLTYDLVSFR